MPGVGGDGEAVPGRAPHFQMAHTLDCQKQLLTNTLSFVSVLGGRSLGFFVTFGAVLTVFRMYHFGHEEPVSCSSVHGSLQGFQPVVHSFNRSVG